MEFKCQICGNSDNNSIHEVNEKMLGTLDTFTYFKCSSCDCLQIAEIPKNISAYYPNSYYSFNAYKKLNKKRTVRGWIDKHRVNDELFEANILGRLLNLLSKPLDYIPYLKPINIKKDTSILDIGCGTGRLLQRMAMGGFTNLTGLDPFIEKNISYHSNVTIIKSSIENFSENNEGKFNVIMLHHSFEHMPSPLDILTHVYRLLAKDGVIILRIPLVDSYAWQTYKGNWVQLDAPRHFFLHSKKSLEILLDKSGFEIFDICYDSSKFQFMGSELYRRNIPLNSPKRDRNIFTKKDIKNYSTKAKEVNKDKNGDQAIFYIRKSR